MYLFVHSSVHIYQSLIVPYITYGLPDWGQACKSYLDKILQCFFKNRRKTLESETTFLTTETFVQKSIFEEDLFIDIYQITSKVKSSVTKV